MILKNLSGRRILHFIPHRKVPSITYLRSREEKERLVIPAFVYEDRKAEFQKRVKSVIEYATNDNVCRSRQLLRYFGETNTSDCNQCDVCLSHNGEQVTKDSFTAARESILKLLGDHKPHHITEISSIPLSSDDIDAALKRMMNEEEIVFADGCLMLKAGN